MKKQLLTIACAIGLISNLSASQYIESIGDYTYSNRSDSNPPFGSFLYITNTSNPKNPQLLSTYNGATDGMWAFDIEGDYAYYSGLTTTGFSIVDMTNKSHPTQIGGFDDGNNYISRIKSDGDYAYVMSQGGDNNYTFQTVDVSDKSNPILEGNVNLGEINQWDTVSNITLESNYAYVGMNEVKVLDISDKTNPQLVESIDVGRIGYNKENNVEFLSVVDGYLYVAMSNGFKIMDVRDINNPIEVGEYSDSRSVYENELVVEGHYVYYSQGYTYADEVAIVDVSDKSNPTSVGSIILNKEGTPYSDYISIDSIAVNGDYLYITTYKRDENYNKVPQDTLIVDISDKLNPVIIFPNDNKPINPSVLMYLLN